jgi:large conductance mechanosensitive channel
VAGIQGLRVQGQCLFLIIAFILFQLVKVSNRMKKAEPAPPPPGPSASEKLLAEIRDALVKKK